LLSTSFQFHQIHLTSPDDYILRQNTTSSLLQNILHENKIWVLTAGNLFITNERGFAMATRAL
jgi:hypothetical protein